MKRIKGDPKYTKIAVYVLITGALLMVIYKLIGASENLWSSISEFFKFLYGAIKPIVAGFIIAYILIPASSLFEKGFKKIFKKPKRAKLVRALSLVLVYILVIGAVFSCIYFIIPSIVENIAEFINNVPDYYETINDWYLAEVAPSDLINNEYTQQAIERGINSFNEGINDFLVSAITGIATFTFSVVSGVVTALIALVISLYVVSGRRKIAGELTITSAAYLGKERTDKIKDFLKSVDWVFGRYISAKLVQIILIFVLCQIAFLIIGAPYSTFLALIIALTNVVPFIGPIIGAVPAVLITLLESPILALWVLIAILIIQTIDAYIFQPFFIGDKMGLSPFWVLVSVILGGSLFGAIGILLSVPVAAVVKLLIKKYVIKSRKGKVPKKQKIMDEQINSGEKT